MKSLTLKVFSIVTILCLIYSCGSDADIVPDQREAIVTYLEAQQIEYTIEGGVYKSIENFDRFGREDLPDSKVGDSLIINFEAYIFKNSPNSNWYYTNKRELVVAVEGLNTAYWNFDPLRVKVGGGTLMQGVENGLTDCRVGDVIQLYITSDLAYGDKPIDGVPSNSAILYVLNIIDLKQ